MTITDAQTLTTETPGADAAEVPAVTIDLTARDEQPTSRPTFTITDAAAACAVSRKTITRKLGDLALHGAAKDDDGIWRIPVEALLAVGLHPGRSLPAHSPRPATPPASAAPVTPTAPAPTMPDTSAEVVTVPRQRWDDLRIRLARAEAEAAERALALADARLALRALTAGPARQADGGATTTAAVLAPLSSPVAASPSGQSDPIVLGAAPSGVGQPATSGATPDAAAQGAVLPQGAPDTAAQLAAARSHAAQNGGYVPAAPAAQPRKRRWWHAK